MAEQQKDLFDFKAVVYKHLDRVLGAPDDKTFAKYVERMLYVLFPHAEKSKKFKELAGELVEDGKVSENEAHEVLMALSYVMQETDLSPPTRIEGVIDAETIELLYRGKDNKS